MGRPYAWRACPYQREPISQFAQHVWNRAIWAIWWTYDANHGPWARPFTTPAIFTDWIAGYAQEPLHAPTVCRYLRRHGLIQEPLRPQMAYRDLDGQRRFKPRLMLWSWTDREMVYRMSNPAKRAELMRQAHGVFADADSDEARALLTPLFERADHYRAKLEEQERLLRVAEAFNVSPESLGYRIGTHGQLTRHANAAELALRQVTLSAEDAKPRTGYVGFDDQGKIKRKATRPDRPDRPDRQDRQDPPDWF